MPSSWDRPVNSLIPNRQGEPEAEAIYLALGKAVSAWEGVSAALSSAFYAMLSEIDRQEIDCTELDQFGDLNNVHKRVKQFGNAWKEFSAKNFGEMQLEIAAIDKAIELVKPSIRGWAERRNDLAHGYVTEAEGPDYAKNEQPIIRHFSLCPSHARSSKWPHTEPHYNYVSQDIEVFVDQFEKLDREIEIIAERIEKIRSFERDVK